MPKSCFIKVIWITWLPSKCVCSYRSLFRRHADGTYTSDVSSYLQDQAAKEFVSWLKTGRGRREWTQPEHPNHSLNNATIHTDSVLLYVSVCTSLFFLVLQLNPPHKKLCLPSVVEGYVHNETLQYVWSVSES